MTRSLPSFALLTLFAAAVLLVLVYVRSLVRWRARTHGRPFPPGPNPLPIVGNMFNMPKFKPWIAYRDLSAKFGDIIHFRVLGQSIVVLGSADILSEYLDKRSANTSDRKQSLMIELTGSELNIGLMPYGQWWRWHRRAFWQYFRSDAAVDYRPAQRAVAHRFLELLLEDPSRSKDHIRFTFAGSMLKIMYDIDVVDKDNEYMAAIDDALEGISEGMVPGRFLVEFLPFLRHIPPWVPGTGSQKLFKKWQAAGYNMKNLPFAYVKSTLERQEQSYSVVAKLLARLDSEAGESFSEEEEIVKNVGAVTFEAASDTTFSTLQSMFLGVSLHPEVLKKAHDELDAVVGPHRLPDFDDWDSLVYVSAIIKESLRWLNVLPTGVPHCTTADDELRGYFIPAGTVLLPNTWACMHDPTIYEDPDEFRPERFIRDGKLDPSVRDPAEFVFGYGRRICPGRYFAEASLFINIASVLHVFDITPPLSKDGSPIKIQAAQTDGLLSYPEDCRCTIKPRSAAAEALILAHTTIAQAEAMARKSV